MLKRVQIALAVALVTLAGVIAWQGLRLREREPLYQGKRLSVWLEIAYKAKWSRTHWPDNERPEQARTQAMHAIRHIGTNALPVLSERLHAQDTALKQVMMTWAQKQNLVPFHFKSADQRRWAVVGGYEALGPLARAQVPSLMDTLTNDPSPSVRQAAANALGYVGPEARVAAPALFRATKDTDSRVRTLAFEALGRILPDPQRTIPVLVAGLDDLCLNVEEAAAIGLGEYGPEARAAVPALVAMLATNNAAELDYAVLRTALKKIDPAAAAKAGVK
jgi:HEAT repeat protein